MQVITKASPCPHFSLTNFHSMVFWRPSNHFHRQTEVVGSFSNPKVRAIKIRIDNRKLIPCNTRQPLSRIFHRPFRTLQFPSRRNTRCRLRWSHWIRRPLMTGHTVCTSESPETCKRLTVKNAQQWKLNIENRWLRLCFTTKPGLMANFRLDWSTCWEGSCRCRRRPGQTLVRRRPWYWRTCSTRKSGKKLGDLYRKAWMFDWNNWEKYLDILKRNDWNFGLNFKPDEARRWTTP